LGLRRLLSLSPLADRRQVLKAVVGIRQHSQYNRCAGGQLPTAESLCEPGASAWDLEDGNLTPRVLACPPTACLERGCPGHEFAAKGLSGCLNTSAPVGTTFEVNEPNNL
jgi:hypothetical protein